MQPSFSGLFVTWAYFPAEGGVRVTDLPRPFTSYSPQMTFPLCVTSPSSLMFTLVGREGGREGVSE